MMVCLLLYAYCVGVFSSRKMATACERNLAFLAIVGDDRPDFRTISDFRKLHLEAFADLFTQVLRLAKAAAGATNCPRNCSGAKTDWRRFWPPSSAWRSRPAPRRRPSGNAARRSRPS